MEIITTLLLLGQAMILQIREGSSTETGTPVLTMEPMWERFLKGDQIVLSCDAGRELHSVRYKWFVNNTIKEFSEKIYTIEAAGIEHNGEYRCQTLTQTTADSNSILVRVSAPELFVRIETEPEPLWYEQTLRLSCNCTYPTQNEFIYTFYQEGSVIAEFRTRNKSVSFQKERVTFEDTGRYRCQMQFVDYPDGPVYTSAYRRVDVRESPVILQVDPRLQRDGDPITLNCRCTQDHVCGTGQIYFYRNETLLNSDSMPRNVHRIHRATLIDSGWYRCAIFQNLSEFLSLWMEVTVQIPVSCPSISSDLKEPAVSIGDHFTIRCTSENGTLPINLMLYHDHHPHPLRNTTVVDSRTATFHVTVPPDGEGAAYSCGAANAVAHVINCSEPLVLTVSGPSGKFALQVGGSAVAAILLIVFLLLFAVCKLHHKERHQDTSGSQSRRDTSSPNHDEIVYSVVQAKKKEGGSVRTRREPQECDSRVTYASLMHLETPKVQEASARGEEENGSSIYQNFQRSHHQPSVVFAVKGILRSAAKSHFWRSSE
ncbi:Fc receptor-like protein 3 isoform X5 [Stegostoma tigrinum]|uniref:Fc receptor-like protein 3 isoform X5 n=1 Tax=Stegostoma tigrinum TaxID=3053191 RepID=UPI00286FCC15|nr:Fc receptor-like protein 3 isoform X5 [Stegostoma tigrinum]XP_059498337.1 Fc receptor-like protein 3 isoform X5 [Stegostoma tigrinum]